MARQANHNDDKEVRLQLAQVRRTVRARPGFRDSLLRRLTRVYAAREAVMPVGPTRRLALVGLAGAAAVVFAVLGIVLVTRGGPRPSPAVVAEAILEKGSATVVRGGDLIELSSGSAISLLTADEIRTGPEARVSVSFDDQDAIVVLEETSLVLSAGSPDVTAGGSSAVIELSEGALHAGLMPNRDREFMFKTPLVEASPEGTTFDMWVPDASRTVVLVDEGAVAVEAAQGAVNVAAQEQVDVRLGEPMVVSKSGDDLTVPEGGVLRFLVVPPSQQQDGFSAGVLGSPPEGASFDSSSTAFSWIPGFDQAGRYKLTFVLCRDGRCEERIIAVDVENTNRPPVLRPLADQTVKVGEGLEVSLEANDPDEDALTYLIGGERPEGVELEARSGVFRWVPSEGQVGSWRLTLAVCDEFPLCGTQVLRITVEG